MPAKWYEFHCIPVARVDGEWIDMYNRLGELTVPIEQVAHWACHVQHQRRKRESPPDRHPRAVAPDSAARDPIV